MTAGKLKSWRPIWRLLGFWVAVVAKPVWNHWASAPAHSPPVGLVPIGISVKKKNNQTSDPDLRQLPVCSRCCCDAPHRAHSATTLKGQRITELAFTGDNVDVSLVWQILLVLCPTFERMEFWKCFPLDFFSIPRLIHSPGEAVVSVVHWLR